MLRNAEQNVTEPTTKTNPFNYLKMMCPEFVPAIAQIIDFGKFFHQLILETDIISVSIEDIRHILKSKVLD